MTGNAIFESKQVVDTIQVTFEFGDQMVFGETLSGPIVTASVFTGEDANAGDIISDTATVEGTTVVQNITGGVNGVIYQIICVVNGSDSHTYSKSGKIAVINQATAYGS